MRTMSKQNVAVVTGGFSKESVISVRSAKIVCENIDKDLYNSYLIIINDNNWKANIDNKEYAIDKNDFSLTYNNEKILFDKVFMIIHGNPGENGLLQGYFDLLKIPYTASSLLTSAITFNKSITQILAKYHGLNVAKSVLLYKNESYNIDEILNTVGLPCFVKPNNGGSSIGMSKVNDKSLLKEAIEIAFKEDDEVQIEEFLKGTEVTCGVLQKDNEIMALPITEVVSKKEFFDYEAKYNSALSEEITPARISQELTKKIQELSVFVFKKFRCKGVSRIDYIIKNDVPYFIEINTIPGLSEASILPQQAKEKGISLKELFNLMLKNI